MYNESLHRYLTTSYEETFGLENCEYAHIPKMTELVYFDHRSEF